MCAGSHIELSAVQRAGEERATEAALGELGVAVRTVVGHGVKRSRQSAHDQPVLAQFRKNSCLAVA